MSLDFDLVRKRWISYDNGKTQTRDDEEIFSCNITHNLTEMADYAGLYDALWRPYRLLNNYNIANGDHDAEREFELTNDVPAKTLVPVLEAGLSELKKRPDYFRQFNPANGWGSYSGLVSFTEKCLEACTEYPDALVQTDR